MAVRISGRFSGENHRGRRGNIDGARLDVEEMNLLALSTSGGSTGNTCPSSWDSREEQDESENTGVITPARFNILGRMQMRKPLLSSEDSHQSVKNASPSADHHQQINSARSGYLSQSEVCDNNENNHLVSRTSPLLSGNRSNTNHSNNNNNNNNNKSRSLNVDQSSDSPLDFSITKKARFDCSNTESELPKQDSEAPCSRLRNILSMKSPVIPENLTGTILNLSKESPKPGSPWVYSKKSRSPSGSNSESSSCSPVPMDHHSSDFLPSSPTQAEISSGITMKSGGIPINGSPLSVSTTIGVTPIGYSPYRVFSAASLSPVMNQTVPSVNLPLPFETSPPLLTHHISSSAASPNLPFGSGSLPTSAGSGNKGRATRPFKAYPKDPMSFSSIGLYGLPIGTTPGSTEALIHQQSNVAYAEFRKQMLSQSQATRTKRGGHKNGSSDSLGTPTSESCSYGSTGAGSSTEDSHSANEESGKPNNIKTEQQLKDDAYWERRRKNNEAAKRSRDARRAKEDEIAIRAAFLEQENLKLRFELCALKNETAKLRCMLYST